MNEHEKELVRDSIYLLSLLHYREKDPTLKDMVHTIKQKLLPLIHGLSDSSAKEKDDDEDLSNNITCYGSYTWLG